MKKTSIAMCIALLSFASFAQDKPKIIVHSVDARESPVLDVPAMAPPVGNDSPFGASYETVPYTPPKAVAKPTTIINTDKPYIKQEKQAPVTTTGQVLDKPTSSPVDKKPSVENKPVEKQLIQKQEASVPKTTQETKTAEVNKTKEPETKVEKTTKKITETTGQSISLTDLAETIQSYGKPVQIQITKMPDDKHVVLLSGKRFVLDSAQNNIAKQNDPAPELEKKETPSLIASQQISEIQKPQERMVIDTRPVVEQESKTPTVLTFFKVTGGLLVLAGLVYFFFGRKRQESYWFS